MGIMCTLLVPMILSLVCTDDLFQKATSLLPVPQPAPKPWVLGVGSG